MNNTLKLESRYKLNKNKSYSIFYNEFKIVDTFFDVIKVIKFFL